jgi:DNA polymerase III subunit beta
MAVATIETTETIETVAVEPVITMEFCVNQKALVDKLTSIAPAISKRSPLPILSNVKIHASTLGVSLTATNLEMMITARVPLDDTNIYRQGETTTNYKELVEIVKPLKGQTLHFTYKDNGKLTLHAEGFAMELSAMSADEFPASPTDQGEQSVSLPVETFRNLVTLTGFAAATDESRPVMVSIYLNVEADYVTTAAADGFRLATCHEFVAGATAWAHPILMPAYSLLPLVKNSQFPKTGHMTISASATQVKLEVGGMTIVSRLIEGTFPNYKFIIPTPEKLTTSAIVQTADLLRALASVKAIARDASNITKLHIVEGYLQIEATRDGMAEPMIVKVHAQTEIEEPGYTMMVNWLYLNEVLEAAKKSGLLVTLSFQESSTKPMTVTLGASGDGFTYVLMPMHVNR